MSGLKGSHEHDERPKGFPVTFSELQAEVEICSLRDGESVEDQKKRILLSLGYEVVEDAA